MNTSFDPYLKWLGIRDPQRPPNHYRLLGIDLFESDPDVIATAADRQMAHVRRYQSGQHAQVSQDILNELAAAKLLLLNPDKKAIFDRTLRPSEPPRIGGEVRWGRWALLSALAVGILAVTITAVNRDKDGGDKDGGDKDDGEATTEVADADGGVASPTIADEASPPDNAVGNQDNTGGDPNDVTGTVEPILPAIPDPDSSPDVNPAAPDTGNSQVATNHVAPPWVTETIERQPYEIRQTGTVLDDIRQAIAEGDLDEAVRELTAAEKEAPGDPALAGLRAITRALSDFHLAVRAALKGGAPVGTRLEYGRSTVVIEDIDESSIVLRSPHGETQDFPAAPQKLPALLATTLAKHVLQQEVDSRAELLLGAFWAFDERGNQFKAQLCLEDARRLLGPEVDMMLDSWQVPGFGGQDSVRTAHTAGRLGVPERKEISRTWRELQRELPARIAKQKFQAADLLLTRADQERDSARRYVLLDWAARYASQSDNTVVALKAIDGIVTDFDVDVLAIRHFWLEKLISTADPRHAAQVAQAAMFAMEESFDADEYSQAQKFLAIANSTAKKTADRKLVERATELRGRLSFLKKAYRETADARRTLAQDPNDPGANAVMGRFLCFSKADFTRGLPHLAKSNDTQLRGLSELTLRGGTNPEELVEVADGWWAVAENLSRTQRSNAISYAVSWYKRAEPRVTQTQVEHVRQRLLAAQSEGAVSREQRREL